MAIQTELEYTSTGVGPIPSQYESIAVGSPVLEYSHVNIGTTPEPEPMSLASSPQQPTTIQQVAILETPQPPSLDLPAAPPVETGPSTTEVNFPPLECFVLSDRDFVVSATEPLTHGNEFHTV